MSFRKGRKRSSSGGSFADTSTSSAASHEPLRKLCASITNFRDRNGKPLSHTLPASLLDTLIRRLQSVDPLIPLSTLLLPRDEESGYPVLHDAIHRGDLAKILSILRCALQNEPPRLSHRVWDLLDQNFTANGNMAAIVSLQDNEGFTPAALLRNMTLVELGRCRLACRYSPSVTTSRRRERRSSSFDEIAEGQDEFRELSDNLQAISPDNGDDKRSDCEYACEVVTFGATSDSGRPQRMQEFALQEVGRDDGVAHVAAAQHHTLIVTRRGRIYSYGHHQGGRLGVPSADKPLSVPTRISRLNHKRVIHAAAALNHSLCVTSCGRVYAFGSNRFGQLGEKDVSGRNFPKCVDDLREKVCVAVAAGEKHSVVLTQVGEIYVWGSNEAGQLGLSRRSGVHKVQRLESLWNTQKVATNISAAHESTLAIIAPSERSHVASVFAWGGQNCSTPTRVVFGSHHASTRPIIPIDVACGRHHNVAISQDGLVYTWGVGEMSSLGLDSRRHDQTTSMMISSPQLVEGMLPERGGGLAVEVSASDSHTAVVTKTGDVFSWGHSVEQNVLGRQGERWQPHPQRVPGIHQAIGISVAKAYTVVMVGTNCPSIPPVATKTLPSLEDLAARRAVQHVDLFNVIPVLIAAERTQSELLSGYCKAFIRRNLAGVLNVAQRSSLDAYVSEHLRDDVLCTESTGDHSYHPIALELTCEIDKGCFSVDEHRASGPSEWRSVRESSLRRVDKARFIMKYMHSSIKDSLRSPITTREHRRSFSPALATPSARCVEITQLDRVASLAETTLRLTLLQKEIRGVRKKLGQISSLETSPQALTTEQLEKIARKSQLQVDLGALKPAIVTLEQKMKELELKSSQNHALGVSVTDGVNASPPPEAVVAQSTRSAPVKFRCSVCNVNCSDQANLDIHLIGRRHRNKLAQVATAEKAEIAAKLERESQKERLSSSFLGSIVPTSSNRMISSSSDKVRGMPAYRLPPPPHSTPGALSSSPKAPSLRDIMAQEQVKSQAAGMRGVASPMGKTKSSKKPWASAPSVWLPPGAFTGEKLHSSSIDSPAVTSKGRGMYSLGDFLVQAPKTAPSAPGKASWASPSAPPVRTGTPSLSLRDIQTQEELLRANFIKSTPRNGRWFVSSRKAPSLRDIMAQEQVKSQLAGVRDVTSPMGVSKSPSMSLASAPSVSLSPETCTRKKLHSRSIDSPPVPSQGRGMYSLGDFLIPSSSLTPSTPTGASATTPSSFGRQPQPASSSIHGQPSSRPARGSRKRNFMPRKKRQDSLNNNVT